MHSIAITPVCPSIVPNFTKKLFSSIFLTGNFAADNNELIGSETATSMLGAVSGLP
jgi:hypothetical protein